jgi:hypothetical protein
MSGIGGSWWLSIPSVRFIKFFLKRIFPFISLSTVDTQADNIANQTFDIEGQDYTANQMAGSEVGGPTCKPCLKRRIRGEG